MIFYTVKPFNPIIKIYSNTLPEYRFIFSLPCYYIFNKKYSLILFTLISLAASNKSYTYLDSEFITSLYSVSIIASILYSG